MQTLFYTVWDIITKTGQTENQQTVPQTKNQTLFQLHVLGTKHCLQSHTDRNSNITIPKQQQLNILQPQNHRLLKFGL